MAEPAAKAIIAELDAKLAPLGPFRAKAMFGGYGLYLDGIIFGLIVGEHIYLKVDGRNRPDFATMGSEPFRYDKRTGEVTIDSYWRCPDAVLAEAGTLLEWVARAQAASRRIAAAKARTGKPRAGKPRASRPRPRRNPFL